MEFLKSKIFKVRNSVLHIFYLNILLDKYKFAYLGEELGHISFVCSFSCYGTGLLPHIETKATGTLLPHIETKATGTIQRQFNKALKENNVSNYKGEANKEINDEPSNKVNVYQKPNTQEEKNKHTNAIVQTLKIDYKDAAIQMNQETNKHNDSKKTLEKNKQVILNQIEEPPEKKTANIYSIKHAPDENAFRHYCPPSLHYNSKIVPQSIKEVEKLIDQKTFAENRIQYLNQIACNIEEINYDSNSAYNDDNISEETELKDYFVKEEPTGNKISNQLNTDQTSMMKCLFEEMNLIRNMLEAKSEPKNMELKQSKQIKSESNQTGILQQQKKYKVKSLLKNENTIQSVNRLSSSQKEKTEINFDEIYQPKKEIKREKKIPLKYGSTNSHRIRVLKNNQKNIEEINKKHENLISQIKDNIDSFNRSNTQVFNESLGNNLEKGRFIYSFNTVAPKNDFFLLQILQKIV